MHERDYPKRKIKPVNKPRGFLPFEPSFHPQTKFLIQYPQVLDECHQVEFAMSSHLLQLEMWDLHCPLSIFLRCHSMKNKYQLVTTGKPK